MMASLQRLIESLRNELQQYGEMLALLEQQRQIVMNQTADDVLHIISAINDQSNVIHKARQIREGALSKLARGLGLEDQVSFFELIPKVPEAFRPLITALVQENHALLSEVRRKAEENHGQLKRSIKYMKSFIKNLSSEEARIISLTTSENGGETNGPTELKAIA